MQLEDLTDVKSISFFKTDSLQENNLGFDQSSMISLRYLTIMADRGKKVNQYFPCLFL